jgi:hypothetical protein
MPSQKDAGTNATGYVTASQSPGPRQCSNCTHYEGGLCNGEYVMKDPELKAQRVEDGRVKVAPNAYCWFYEAKT